MRTILPIIVFALLPACAGLTQQKTAQALHMATCVVEDERLGAAIKDPQVAVDYLESVKAEIAVLHSEINDIRDAWASGNTATLEDELEVLERALVLLHDLEDLARRLQACITAGKSAS